VRLYNKIYIKLLVLEAFRNLFVKRVSKNLLDVAPATFGKIGRISKYFLSRDLKSISLVLENSNLMKIKEHKQSYRISDFLICRNLKITYNI
jgi:hypothetical protein